MASISKLLAKEGLVLERPGNDTAPVISASKKRKVDFTEPPIQTELPSAARKDPPPSSLKPAPSPSEESSAQESFAESSSAQEESEAESEQSDYYEEDLKMSSKKIVKASPRPKKSGLEDAFAGLSMDGPVVMQQTVSGILPIPVLSGRWSKFDHQKGLKEGFCLMRMFVPNGSDAVDFEFSWINSTTFKIRMKWPIFMVNSLMMTELDVEEEEDMGGDVIEKKVYPDDHPIYDSMGENAENMKRNEKHIWSEGIFRFEREMMFKHEEQLFEIQCENGDQGTILQIKFFEVVDVTKHTTAPMRKVKRNIKYSKSSPSVNPTDRDATRQYSPRRQPPKHLAEAAVGDNISKRTKTNAPSSPAVNYAASAAARFGAQTKQLWKTTTENFNKND